MTTSLPLCRNCQSPATVRWTMRDGSEEYACGDCKPLGGVEAHPVSPVAVGWPDVLDVAEAADYLKCSAEVVRRRARNGDLEALPRSGATAPYRFRLSVLEALREAPSAPVIPQAPTSKAPASVEWPS